MDRPPPPPLDRPPANYDPRNDPRDPRNDRPPPLLDPRDMGRPPHPYDRNGFDRYPPRPGDPLGRPPPLPSGSRHHRYDDRGDWWGPPRDRMGGPPGPSPGSGPAFLPPPPMPPAGRPHWDEQWNGEYYDHHYNPNPGPPPSTYAASRP
jgi:hypothetical protein